MRPTRVRKDMIDCNHNVLTTHTCYEVAHHTGVAPSRWENLESEHRRSSRTRITTERVTARSNEFGSIHRHLVLLCNQIRSDSRRPAGQTIHLQSACCRIVLRNTVEYVTFGLKEDKDLPMSRRILTSSTVTNWAMCQMGCP